MRVLCQWNILIQGGQIQEIFRRVWQKEKVSALLRHLCRFPDYTVSDILFIARQRMREYKLKSKNSYELYYSRKIGKSSYMGMEQVCEENCHSLQGNWLSLFGLGLSPDRACLFWNCAGYDPALFCILENIIHRLYMSKGIKKTDNYFERVKQRANRTNYRYYFFDYLYFKGEQGHKMRSRCSGVLMLSLYWWFIIEIPCIPLFDRNLPHTWYLLCCMGMFLFPVLFCLVRYRKDRTSALVNHYRHSSKNKITITLLLLLPMVLCGFELWLLAKLGWIICKWC